MTKQTELTKAKKDLHKEFLIEYRAARKDKKLLICGEENYHNWLETTIIKLRADQQKKLYQKDNHKIGCELESIAQLLRFRGCDKEADQLDHTASRIK